MSLAKEMAELASRFVASTDDATVFDFGLASLPRLEAVVARQPIAEATTRTWGAYLGQTIRQQSPDVITWVDHATAAATSSAVRGLGYGPDISAILRVGADGYWFPLTKVEKFQRNGKQDSLAAFAGVVLAMAPRAASPDQDERERARRAEGDERALAAGTRFRDEPTAATLCELVGAVGGNVHYSRYAEIYRQLELRTDELTCAAVALARQRRSSADRPRAWRARARCSA